MRTKKIERVRLEIDNTDEEVRCDLHVGYDSGGAYDCTNDPMNEFDKEGKVQVITLLQRALNQIVTKFNEDYGQTDRQ